MIRKVKFIFQQAVMISFGITCAIGLQGVFQHFINGTDIEYSWYMPISAALSGIVCAFPSLLFDELFEKKRNTVIIRIVIHCFCLYAMAAGLGKLFNWYTDLNGFTYVTVAFFLIYIFVWVGSLLLNKQEDKKINEALKAIQDEE